ncbi:UDP-glucoronosyl and UDP-glucosyl transferase domain-containing protein [Phthorimaea operculella]|nr:UDP-glucoronosyl and UDP-glucosyl transferase domain-containing protein [Phthorimaea operculella]
MRKILSIVVAVLFTLSLELSEGSKILVVFPFPGKSHNILGEGFVRTLLKAGHEVTYATPFPKKEVAKNLRYIDLSDIVEDFQASMASDPALDLKKIADKTSESLVMTFAKGIFSGKKKSIMTLPNETLHTANFQKFMNDPNEKFDLVIIEWMFAEVYSGLSAVFDCPYIWVVSGNPHWMVLDLIDEIPNPAFNPEIMSSNIPPLDFFQRARELFMTTLWGGLRMMMMRGSKQTYQNVFSPILAKRGKPLPPFEEIIYNGSLMLANSHESTGWARNLPQNFKNIAGYHIDPEVKPLPKDLQSIMDNAKDGVIYFSLGSNLKSTSLPDEIKQSLLKMFGALKYTVLWKFEEQLPGLPKNVHILKWAPQPSILAHPNCKLFITHGGLLSTIETIHFGVPIIGIPVFADQFSNVELSKKKGFALRVDISYEMADDLKAAIEEILGNPKYKATIENLNFIFHDRPVSPSQELVHWVNHVIKTKGAAHLRSMALMTPWWQKLYLDLLALVAVVMYVIVKALKYIFKPLPLAD